MKGNWVERFKQMGVLEFNDSLFENSMKSMEEDLPLYLNHLKPGANILECACGPGFTAIPLSHYFNVTAFDRDDEILQAAKQNGNKYGKNIKFQKLDFNKILQHYGKDSFNAVSSGGVLEHFPKTKIKKFINLSLEVAPIVFASMPLFTQSETEKINHYGIKTYFYTKDDWKEILSKFNLLEERQLIPRPEKGKFREYTIILGR